MKNITYLLILSCFPGLFKAQNVGINNTGAAPVASAMLDIVSSANQYIRYLLKAKSGSNEN